MSLYPSLEDMKVDQMMQAQVGAAAVSAAVSATASAPPASSGGYPAAVAMPNAPTAAQSDQEGLPYPLHPTGPGFSSVYPALNSFMGMEFNEDTIRQNMPEYLQVYQNAVTAVQPSNTQIQSVAPAPSVSSGMVAPISGQSRNFATSQISHGVRSVILCKDAQGKVGLRVKSIDKGVFVALVTKASPAAMGGLRFGDQILQINGENVAGYDEAKVHKIFKKAGVNNICLAVRDRPFERTLTLHKDSTGHIGFQFKDGEIKAIIVDSSAARNGLLIQHHLVEVNGQNVVGLNDKSIGDIIDGGGNVVTVTVIPSFVYKHMVKNMSYSVVKKMMFTQFRTFKP